MKNFLLLAFITFLSVSSFANGGIIKALDAKNATTTKNDAFEGKVLQAFDMSCTVSASWTNDKGGTVSLTIKATCKNCTRQQACDAAYKLLSMMIPGNFLVLEHPAGPGELVLKPAGQSVIPD